MEERDFFHEEKVDVLVALLIGFHKDLNLHSNPIQFHITFIIPNTLS